MFQLKLNETTKSQLTMGEAEFCKNLDMEWLPNLMPQVIPQVIPQMN